MGSPGCPQAPPDLLANAPAERRRRARVRLSSLKRETVLPLSAHVRPVRLSASRIRSAIAAAAPASMIT